MLKFLNSHWAILVHASAASLTENAVIHADKCNPSIEGTATDGFAACKPSLMSNLGRVMKGAVALCQSMF
jgi:hypothetical protein